MAKDAEKDEEPKKAGKSKLIIMIVPVLLLLGGGYFFFLKPTDEASAAPVLPPPEPGAIVQLDPITINLAGGHFLKLGLALQPTAAAAEVAGAKALDLAIDLFSGRTIEELSTAEGRQDAKEELVARVKLAYVILPPEEEKAPAKSSDDSSEEESDEESSDEESSGEEDSSDEEKSGPELTGKAAIEAAADLTVQPDVYDIYFTEFVMQ